MGGRTASPKDRHCPSNTVTKHCPILMRRGPVQGVYSIGNGYTPLSRTDLSMRNMSVPDSQHLTLRCECGSTAARTCARWTGSRGSYCCPSSFWQRTPQAPGTTSHLEVVALHSKWARGTQLPLPNDPGKLEPRAAWQRRSMRTPVSGTVGR